MVIFFTFRNVTLFFLRRNQTCFVKFLCRHQVNYYVMLLVFKLKLRIMLHIEKSLHNSERKILSYLLKVNKMILIQEFTENKFDKKTFYILKLYFLQFTARQVGQDCSNVQCNHRILRHYIFFLKRGGFMQKNIFTICGIFE